jgi:hypothetical protein
VETVTLLKVAEVTLVQLAAAVATMEVVVPRFLMQLAESCFLLLLQLWLVVVMVVAVVVKLTCNNLLLE